MDRKDESPKFQVSLCPACGACPTVDLYDTEVRIGEAGNQVRLTKEEWNGLVEKIQKGELDKI